MVDSVVFKYKLKKQFNAVSDGDYVVGEFSVPLGSEPLSIQYQNGDWNLWVLIPVGEKRHVKLEVLSIGTGFGTIGGCVEYMTTIQGAYGVWHLFTRMT